MSVGGHEEAAREGRFKELAAASSLDRRTDGWLLGADGWVFKGGL